VALIADILAPGGSADRAGLAGRCAHQFAGLDHGGFQAVGDARRSTELCRCDTDRQAFMAEFVEHVEHPILASIVGAILDKVVGPDMTVSLR
jgi:hypothetical protein